MSNKKEIEQVKSSEKAWPTWRDRIANQQHQLTPKIRKFCYLYVSVGDKHTLEEFAVKFGVARNTIKQWLSWPNVQELVDKLFDSQTERIAELLGNRAEHVVKGMLKIFDSPKTPAEVKRKCGYNLLSFVGVRDCNTGRTVISQQVAVQNQYEKMTDAELKEAMEELDRFEEG